MSHCLQDTEYATSNDGLDASICFVNTTGKIKHLDEILHRILSNVRYCGIYKRHFTSHFTVPVTPIIWEVQYLL